MENILLITKITNKLYEKKILWYTVKPRVTSDLTYKQLRAIVANIFNISHGEIRFDMQVFWNASPFLERIILVT